LDARGAGGNVKPGQVDAVRVVPGVVRTRVEGHAPRSFVTPIIDAVEREIEAGLAPDVFHDWERITTYETATRDTLAAWYADVKDEVSSVHILIGNRVVEMGVAVAALVARAPIHTYHSRSEFDAALHAAVSARNASVPVRAHSAEVG